MPCEKKHQTLETKKASKDKFGLPDLPEFALSIGAFYLGPEFEEMATWGIPPDPSFP